MKALKKQTASLVHNAAGAGAITTAGRDHGRGTRSGGIARWADGPGTEEKAKRNRAQTT